MRSITEQERPLVEFLTTLAGLSVPVSSLKVQSMNDGGMGSLLIGPGLVSQKYGSTAGTCHFQDADGSLVEACLNLDQHGQAFEIDVWKVNFEQLLRWPQKREIVAGLSSGSSKS